MELKNKGGKMNIIKKTTTIVTTLILLLFFSTCEKDFRGKYIGTWEFVVEKSKIIINEQEHFYVEDSRDTIYYLGKISYGNNDNELCIKYTENDVVILRIKECGKLFKADGEGQFERKDKVYLAFLEEYITDSCCIYRTDCIINGIKKSKK